MKSEQRKRPGMKSGAARDTGRILFVVNVDWFFLSHRLPLARAARDAGFEVHVATSLGECRDTIRAEGFFAHHVPFSRKGTNPVGEFRTLWEVLRLYRRVRPDLVHQVTIKPVVYGGAAARLARVPASVCALTGLGHMFVARGPRASLGRAMLRPFLRFALGHPNGRTVFQNPDDRNAFVSTKLVESRRAVLIRGSGVNMVQFSPTEEPEGPPLVVLPARMLRNKGVGDFVDAARRVRADGVAARFALVGRIDPGNPLAVPESELLEWDREGVVEWWGYRDDMPGVFTHSHVVCLPSSYGEGVPKALIEAAASGRAIVTTDTPGCREIVRHGENGMLVPVRDAGALAAALKALIEDPALRRGMGRRGREIAAAEFSVEKIVEETLALYRDLLS